MQCPFARCVRRVARRRRASFSLIAASLACTTILASPSRAQSPVPSTPSAPRSDSLPPTPAASGGACPDTLAVAKLADYAVPGGRVVVLRFGTACRTGGGSSALTARVDSAGAVAALSPLAEAALAAQHAGAAAQATADVAKPSRREAFVALLTAVAVLLLK